MSDGFTVFETMIFLAVSSALFISVVFTLSGQQRRAEFTYGVQEYITRVEDVMNDISTGFYYNSGSFTCRAPLGTVVITPGASQPGQNVDCILVGRVIQFGAKNIPGTSNSFQGYRVLSVAGRRTVIDGAHRRDVQSLNESTTEPIASSTAPSAVTTGILPNGLQIGWIKAGGTPYGAVGFFTSFSQNVDASKALGGVQVIPIPGTSLDTLETPADLLIPIRNVGISSAVPPAGGVIVCIEDGSQTIHARLNLSGNLRKESSNVIIENGRC
jgi:hypothetical protein